MSNKQLIVLNLSVLGGATLIYLIATNWADMDIGSRFVVFVLLAGVLGVLFVAFFLPMLGERIGEFFYTPPEEVQADDRQRAMAKLAQGEYEEAIDLFKKVAKSEPEDRLPIVEIAKIQVDHLHDPDAAIATVRGALDREGWRDNDAAYFHFRLADLLVEHKQETEQARTIYQEVIDKYPETRHSANATHKLHELDAV
ncbi:MAG: tetratricopeptide repeat protein [Verrucomicrobiota bacterium]